MARADLAPITFRRIPLSQLFADPALRTAFRRAEDSGLEAAVTFALPPDRPLTLAGGAAVNLLEGVQ